MLQAFFKFMLSTLALDSLLLPLSTLSSSNPATAIWILLMLVLCRLVFTGHRFTLLLLCVFGTVFGPFAARRQFCGVADLGQVADVRQRMDLLEHIEQPLGVVLADLRHGAAGIVDIPGWC